MNVVFCLAVVVAIQAAATHAYNPCCSFPCQHRSVCYTTGQDSFRCDCDNTGYYGKHCDTPTWSTWFKLKLKPTPETMHHILTHYWPIWAIVNRVPFLRETLMKRVYLVRGEVVDSPPMYSTLYDYPALDVNLNKTIYPRVLPAVPDGCPTPMGVAGKKELPPISTLFDVIFRRRKFIPDHLRTSTLFIHFAQHFTHQFFKTEFKKGPRHFYGGDGVDVSHIYGDNRNTTLMLRTLVKGQLKTKVINGEEWPPHISDAPVAMAFPPGYPDEIKFGLGHRFNVMLPGLFAYATIWIREHNRICDFLATEHPEWDDERLFQTARLIVLGETIKIVIEDYVVHLGNYNFQLIFKPELLFGQVHQYQNRIFIEFNHLYRWHPFFPDEFDINGTVYKLEETFFRPDLAIKHGMRAFVDSLSRNLAGKMTARNHPHPTLRVVEETIQTERLLRFQSFNQYRKRFNLRPYASFLELTGDAQLAKELEELYGDIDGLEFYPGLLLERPAAGAIFGQTIVEMGGPFSVKGLLSSPICTPQMWRPSTFGGEAGFNMVKTATLEKLFCQNMKGPCPLVSFQVPSNRKDVRCLQCDKDEL